ncbi:uncharacterized protein [Coffea arabica]|uniref:Retrotransposon gag domain-containing protein n=1 Tax=Coffea arabica TaxID=13443 RepID=A0ABM4UQV1_COFAR
MASEMAAQKKLIDELINSGVQPEPVPIKQSESEPFVIPPIQTTFEGVFNPQYTYTQNPPFYPPYGQGFQPQGGPNMPLDPQAFYQTTAEPVVTEHTVQTKPEVGESSAPVDMKLLKRLDRFDEFIRKSQGLSKQGVLDYDDLCLFPNVQLPVGFKTPKFNKYDGTGNPKTHLRLFANKLGKPVDDERLPLRLFPESLEGDALDWYSNLKPEELAPTRTTLEGTKRRPSDDHKTYAKRWRKIAAKVEPPMTENEIVRTFIKAHNPPHFEKIFRMTGCSFATIVNKLEEYDDLVRSGKIVNVSALKSQVEALQGQGSSGKKPQFKKKEGDATFIWNQNPSLSPRYQHNPTYQPPYPYYSNPHHVYTTNINHPRPSPNYANPPSAPFQISQPNPPQNRPRPPYNPRFSPPSRPIYSHPQPPEPYNRPPSRTFINLDRPLDQLYDQLKAAEKIGMVPPPTYPYGMPVWYNPQAVCAYHSGAPGHSTLDCKTLKHKVQDMIEAGEILAQKLARKAKVFGVTDQPFVIEVPFEEDKRPFTLDLTPAESEALEPVVIEFPEQAPILNLQQVPWNYNESVIQIGGKPVAKEEVSVVTRSRRIASPFGATVPIQTNSPELPAKPTITEKEVLDFLKRLQRSEYNVVEKLSKSPAQISMLDLLFSSDMHRDALLEVLTKSQIPKDISIVNFSHIVGSVLSTKQITFSDDELPAEGIGYNKALYIAVRYNEKMLPKVLIDNGSALNICSWSTLEKLGLQDIKLRPSGTIVRGFDGEQREPIGEVDLVVEMGPAQFQIACQVMHFPTIYNILLGRSWIHKFGAVPSSLHQLLKFIVNDKLITIFAEEDCLVIADSRSEEDGSRNATVTPHSTADIVFVSWITKEERALSKASVMMAKEMIRGRYEFDKGLGRELQGILKPVKIVEKRDSFSLGFRPTAQDIKEMRERKKAEKEDKQKAFDILPLHYTFPRPTEVIASEINPVDEIETSLAQLFVGATFEDSFPDEAEFPDIPERSISNWTSEFLPIQKEFR